MISYAMTLFIALMIFASVISHQNHLTSFCKNGGYQMLAFYDPTGGPPSLQTLMLQFGHPTYKDCPTLFWGWRREQIDWMEYHNDERPGIINWDLPKFDPPFKLSDGTMCDHLSCLDQVQESR